MAYEMMVGLTVTDDATYQRAIRFADRAHKDAFFADPDYQAVRARFFQPSVQGRTIRAEHERE